MGTIARYLIPVDSEISAAEYGAQAKSILLQLGVISENSDPEDPIYYNGTRSTEPFQVEPGDGECGFDMATIFAGPSFVLAPEEYVDGVVCPKCNADITAQWAPMVRDEDGQRMYDAPDAQVCCPNCHSAWRLDKVKSDAQDKFYLTDRYVSFWDCRPFKPEWLAEFDRLMGCQHETFDYGWT